MGSADYVALAISETLDQLARGVLHDQDFAAFRTWKGAPIRCIMDVGANRGQSLASLHAVLPDAHIYSFEANAFAVHLHCICDAE